MPNYTTNYNIPKPLVDNAIDEDLWGYQQNDGMDIIDTTMKAISDAADAAAQAGVNSDITDLIGIDDTIATTALATQLRLSNDTVINCTNIAGSAQVPVQAGNATTAIQLLALGQLTGLFGTFTTKSYIKIPMMVAGTKRDVIIQFGYVAVSDDQYNSVTFEIPFPNDLLSAFATPIANSAIGSTAAVGAFTGSHTLSGMSVGLSASGGSVGACFWLAIGY